MAAVADQVVGFFGELFDKVFGEAFRPRISDLLRRKAVLRQVEEAADASSQSLYRLLSGEGLDDAAVEGMLAAITKVTRGLTLSQVENPNMAPEELMNRLLERDAAPVTLGDSRIDAVYRVAIHSVLQVLMLIGPVMAEWKKLGFSLEYALPRRVIDRLNQTSEQLGALGTGGMTAADQSYELLYRDYLMQRFHRVEAGTVRMTTNLAVDIRDLFVLPRVQERPRKPDRPTERGTKASLMDLRAARAFITQADADLAQGGEEVGSILDAVREWPRLLIIGTPGSGKSTFLEWLQVMLASAEEELVLAGKQAIPLLLRLRQLDPLNLPTGSQLIAKATLSQERVTLMPPRWADRQLEAGRVVFMVDGMDEVEPHHLEDAVIPWLRQTVERYPGCRYLLSSRPVGYDSNIFAGLHLRVCDLLDFDGDQVRDYSRNWCTSVRLSRNEPEQEARSEGIKEGDAIVDAIVAHPYVRNLANNPLMLSAVCLVRYFEGGELPKDRAVLYRMCVEGLLHNWDVRRGITSYYPMEEKLRACREVALAMQSDDRAEYESSEVEIVFGEALGESKRGATLLEHIRYRTGLLLERRPGVFAFFHLTFQEYLAAHAVHEGNLRGVNVETLADEHHDGRWEEVIALYCALATGPAARSMILALIAQPESLSLSSILAEAYLSAPHEVIGDESLRSAVIARIAVLPGREALGLFSADLVTDAANRLVGQSSSPLGTSEAFWWLRSRIENINSDYCRSKLAHWAELSAVGLSEVLYLTCMTLEPEFLALIGPAILDAPGPRFAEHTYHRQAWVALEGILSAPNPSHLASKELDVAWREIWMSTSRASEEELQSFPDLLFNTSDVLSIISTESIDTSLSVTSDRVLSLQDPLLRARIGEWNEKIGSHIKTRQEVDDG